MVKVIPGGNTVMAGFDNLALISVFKMKYVPGYETGNVKGSINNGSNPRMVPCPNLIPISTSLYMKGEL